jgi:hypothetical protein
MKKYFCVFFSLAIIAGLWANSDQELLAKVDSLVSYPDTDFQAIYSIVQDRPGRTPVTTEAVIMRRDSREQYVIVISKPVENRGHGYLKEGSTLWLYDPKERKFNTTRSADRFQNTNARNSDFTRSTLARDYRVVSGEDVVLGSLIQQEAPTVFKIPTQEIQISPVPLWLRITG